MALEPTPHTISAVCSRLPDGTEYMRRVFVNLCGHPRDSMVRFSTKAADAPPDYMIYDVADVETGATAPIVAFSGKTHRSLPPKKADDWERWAPSMSRDEVASLLGTFRNFTPKGAKGL